MAGTNNMTGNAGGVTKMAGRNIQSNKASKAVDAEFTKMKGATSGKGKGSMGGVKNAKDDNKKTSDNNVAKGNFKPFTKKG